MHISDTAEKRWLQSYLGTDRFVPVLTLSSENTCSSASRQQKGWSAICIPGSLVRSGSPGRGRDLVPALQQLIQISGASESEKLSSGWRTGDVNVLVNILGKSPEDLFSELRERSKPQVTTSPEM